MKKILNNKTLRFRLDKTVPGGKYVKKPKCNIACTWCHLDYFNNKEFAAINNVDFYNIIKISNSVSFNKKFKIPDTFYARYEIILILIFLLYFFLTYP